MASNGEETSTGDIFNSTVPYSCASRQRPRDPEICGHHGDGGHGGHVTPSTDYSAGQANQPVAPTVVSLRQRTLPPSEPMRGSRTARALVEGWGDDGTLRGLPKHTTQEAAAVPLQRDVLGHTVDWKTHLKMLRLFERVRKANLSLKPWEMQVQDWICKSWFPRAHLGNQTESVGRILNTERPTAKKECQSLLGISK